MDRLGIELICVFGLPPIPFVELAADLGCHFISAVLEPLEYNPHGYERYSLRSDHNLRREMVAAMAVNGVSISLGEGFVIRAPDDGGDDPFVPGDGDMRERWAADLDMMAELGITLINSVCMDKDLNRGFDQLGLLAELAAAHGMTTTVEFCPGLGVGDLPTALRAVRHVRRDDFRLLMDPMHLIRSGGAPADVAALDPALIAYAQLCDAPLAPNNPIYIDEAMNQRLAPGMGELPLLDYLAAMPAHVPIGLEVPQSALADAGVGPRERMKPVVAAARDLLTRLERERGARSDEQGERQKIM